MDDAQFLEELKKDFFDEAFMLIESLEANILVIEKEPDNEEAINEIFRAAHTLKGGSATLDLDRIASFTHEMENLLDEVRGGKIKLNSDIIDTLLKSIDIVKTLIYASQKGENPPEGLETVVIEAIKLAATGQAPGTGQAATDKEQTNEPGSTPTRERKYIPVNLNEYERYLVKNAPAEGLTIFEVYVALNNNNPMKTVSGLQIHSQLKEISEIVKSVPDIDDLMSDQFSDDLLFIIQTDLSADEIHKKVYLSDVTDVVDVRNFTDEIEETEAHANSSSLNLNDHDLESIETQISSGQKVYKIIVTFDDSNPMRSVSGVLFYTMLRTKGEIINASPSYEDYKLDAFYPSGEFIFASSLDSESLRQKLYLSDVTKDLKFQEFKSEASQPSRQVSQTSNSLPDSQNQSQSPVTKSEPVKSEPAKPEATAKPSAPGAEEPHDKKQLTSVLRVESSRIDEMLNLVGELVIIKAGFMQTNDQGAMYLEELNSAFNQYKVLTRQLNNDLIDFFESQENGSNESVQTSSASGKTTEISVHKYKELVKDKLNELMVHFDLLIPKYKHIQEKMKGSSQSLSRITDDLQEGVMKVRMVTINQIFSRFPRLVRDISKNLKKEINLVMIGEETELDKSVIEDLVDPLIHIVRNAVDHGIESPADRQASGKDATGTIQLKAEHEGNTVSISISDDGKGLNLQKIKKKAIENKLIEANQDISDSEIMNLIFHPGFSTADEVTSLSGRGVGMDVVRKKIENLGGVVEIKSEEGKGSQFAIKIPLTLAIIQALLVQVGDFTYSIPINSVIETLRIGPEDIEILENTEVIRVREEILSLVQLDNLFKHRSSDKADDYFYVIVVGTSGRKVGLGVDNLVGEQDVVIKPLNNKYTNVQGIAGATILGDGQVSLVLDVPGLFNLVLSQKKHLSTKFKAKQG